VFSTEIIDHGSCCGNGMQALIGGCHPVASSEAWDVFHRAMCPASYRHIHMVIKIASNLPTFLVIVDFNHSPTVDNDHIMVNKK
jgi:hypothetical protein